MLMSWQPTYPNHAHKVKDVPAILQGNWVAINSALSAEHTATAHPLGGCGILFYGPTSEISALSPPGSGAMAFDTTLGVPVIHNGSAWQTTGYGFWPRARAYSSATRSLSASESTPKVMLFDTDDVYDTLGNYNNATGYFTVPSSGSYIVMASIACSGTSASSNLRFDLGIYASRSADPINSNFAYVKDTHVSPYHTVNALYMGYFATGETICAKIFNSGATAYDIVPGATTTFIAIHRLPWSGF
jgi:hypothetical protein